MSQVIASGVTPRWLLPPGITSERQHGHTWNKLPFENSLARCVAYGTTTTGVEMSSSQVASGAGNSTAPTLRPCKLWIIASMEGIV